MLARLRSLLELRGRLSGAFIEEMDEMPSPASYRHRFGSLIRAYELVGYAPERDYAFVQTNRQLRQLYPPLVDDVVRTLTTSGAHVDRNEATDLLTVNRLFTVSIALSRYEVTAPGSPRWTIRKAQGAVLS